MLDNSFPVQRGWARIGAKGLNSQPRRPMPTLNLTLPLHHLHRFCSRTISTVDVSGDTSLKSRKAALLDMPDIVIGTPSKVVAHIEAGNMDLTESLKMLVVDEADLVFSYGYQDDVVNLLAKLPAIRQNMLMSATLGSEVDALKKLVLRRPVVLKLEESDLPDERQLLQVGQQAHLPSTETTDSSPVVALYLMSRARPLCVP